MRSAAEIAEPVLAGSADAEQLHGVADVGETVRVGDLVCPSFDRRSLHLDRLAAGATHQVMVVRRAACAVGSLAPGGAQDVCKAGVDQGLESPIDGCQPSGCTAG